MLWHQSPFSRVLSSHLLKISISQHLRSPSWRSGPKSWCIGCCDQPWPTQDHHLIIRNQPRSGCLDFLRYLEIFSEFLVAQWYLHLSPQIDFLLISRLCFFVWILSCLLAGPIWTYLLYCDLLNEWQIFIFPQSVRENSIINTKSQKDSIINN